MVLPRRSQPHALHFRAPVLFAPVLFVVTHAPTMMDKPPQAATVAEQIFLRLRADILAAKLRPGEKLQIEKLREIYEVGSTPLREALSRLSSSNLVVAEGQRGFRVAPVSRDELLDIAKTRAWVEGIALRAAIAAGDRNWEAQILAAAHRLQRLSDEVGEIHNDEWFRENEAFHNALVAAGNAPHLMQIRAQLYSLSDRYRRLAGVVAPRDVDREHQDITRAVLARNAELAVEITENHFVTTVEVILRSGADEPDEITRIITGLRRDILAGRKTA